MKRLSLVICLIALAATACQPGKETAAAPSHASPSIATQNPETPSPAANPASYAEMPTLAGTFEGTIACEGDCQTTVSITFNASGTYAKSEKIAYGDGTGEASSEKGTWLLDTHRNLITLAPDGGQTADKWYASLVSQHEINILGSKDAAYDPLYSIKRKPVI